MKLNGVTCVADVHDIEVAIAVDVADRREVIELKLQIDPDVR
jgi:hypothetical protein